MLLLEFEQIKVSWVMSKDVLVELMLSGILERIGPEVVLDCLLEVGFAYDVDELVERGTTLGISDAVEVGFGLLSI